MQLYYNQLILVWLTATHIADGSIRMEPVFMELGKAAAVAASLAIDTHQTAQGTSNDIQTIGNAMAKTEIG